MTRLDRVIKGFNDYDNLVKSLIMMLDEVDGTVAEYRVNKLRNEISPLIGELKRYGCRRNDDERIKLSCGLAEQNIKS
jgi:hypothetical protein